MPHTRGQPNEPGPGPEEGTQQKNWEHTHHTPWNVMCEKSSCCNEWDFYDV